MRCRRAEGTGTEQELKRAAEKDSGKIAQFVCQYFCKLHGFWAITGFGGKGLMGVEKESTPLPQPPDRGLYMYDERGDRIET